MGISSSSSELLTAKLIFDNSESSGNGPGDRPNPQIRRSDTSSPILEIVHEKAGSYPYLNITAHAADRSISAPDYIAGSGQIRAMGVVLELHFSLRENGGLEGRDALEGAVGAFLKALVAEIFNHLPQKNVIELFMGNECTVYRKERPSVDSQIRMSGVARRKP